MASLAGFTGVFAIDWPDATWKHLAVLMSASLSPDSPIPACLAGIYTITGTSPPASLAFENIFTDCLKFEVDAVLQRRAAESLAAALRLSRCGANELRGERAIFVCLSLYLTCFQGVGVALLLTLHSSPFRTFCDDLLRSDLSTIFIEFYRPRVGFILLDNMEAFE